MMFFMLVHPFRVYNMHTNVYLHISINKSNYLYYLHYQLALERKEVECSFHDFVLPSFESAFVDVMNSHLVHQCCLFCLNTAHPGKFPYFVAEALDAPAGNIMPKDIQE